MSEKTIKTICFECHSRCGVLVTVSDGRITGITGDKNHPFSPGFICPKGWAVIEIVYHPDRINQGLKNGSKLIVMDPRRTRFAEKADHFLQIRPGTDVALALGFLHVIIENNLYDRDFVERWATGFDKLKDYVVEFTPERSAEITWIPAEKIVAAATCFAQKGPACIGPQCC